jgi:hypothetical protein
VVTDIEAGMVNVTRRVLPAMVVTAVAVAVMAAPPAAGAMLTVTLEALIVPVGKFEPVNEMLVTPGWPALGEAVAVNVTATGL